MTNFQRKSYQLDEFSGSDAAMLGKNVERGREVMTDWIVRMIIARATAFVRFRA